VIHLAGVGLNPGGGILGYEDPEAERWEGVYLAGDGRGGRRLR
jgi:hypothetical protein